MDSAYWQVAIDGPDREKTAFVVHNGLYHFRTMSFGLCNSPSTFGRLMHRVLGSLQYEQCLMYLDDVIVYGRTFEEHCARLRNVLAQVERSGLKLKPSKCSLFQKKVSFLGYVVSEDGIETDPDKVKQVAEWPIPRCVREVRSFVGLASYYRRFVPNFSDVCKPLHRLTEKGRRFHWTPECQLAFEALKERLTSAPILAYPEAEGTFILDTDASQSGIGAVLSQIQDGRERGIAYASTTMNKHEKRYCVTRKEMLALVKFVRYFRPYLYGRKFLIRSDHGSLRWLFNFREPEGQIARWLEILAEYQFEIQHRPGRLHGNADALSRVLCDQYPQCKRDSCPSVVATNATAGVTDQGSRDVPCKQVGRVWTALVYGAVGHVIAWVFTVISWLSLVIGVPHRSSKSELGGCRMIAAQDAENQPPDCPAPCRIQGMTPEQLRQEQLRDPDVGEILRRKDAGEGKPTWPEISAHSQFVKALWALWDQLCVRDGILYLARERAVLALVVPRALRDKILRLVHDGPTGGHLGSERPSAGYGRNSTG